ncbi:M10 family metallopeptidase C-terminal domain-containing protein [Allosphingosinicella sp.]|jgi:VCBS repeat-containing protein|uniref:M10 family metallopeptidase C-terminal domain-containing protein n=1 Tax=Allosphingosinicella sp. TaxID=2823234 RepID=UPI002F0CC07E
MPIIDVAERNDAASMAIAGNLGVAVAGIGRAGRSSTGVGTWFQGTYGAILLNPDGSYTYRLDNLDPDTNVLGSGQTGEDRFSYTYVENGAVRTGTLVVRVAGVDETNQLITQTETTLLLTTDTAIAAAHRIVSTAQPGVRVTGTQSDVSVLTNDGSILVGSAAASVAGGLGSYLFDYGRTINNGRIEAVVGREGMGATAVASGDFVNNGVVSAYSSAFEAGGVFYLRRAVGFLAAEHLVNNGTIEAVSLHGEAFGIWTGVIAARIVNNGYLYVSGGGTEVTGIRAGQSHHYLIENNGIIHAVSTDPTVKSVGISLFRDGTNPHAYGTVVNSGTVVADVAIRAYAGYLTGIHVTNSGHIEGALDFDWGLNIVRNLAGGEWIGDLAFGLHQDVMLNAGLVTGNVLLGAGADLFDGRGGTVSGIVYGGTGPNILFGGGSADRLTGGAEADWIAGGGGGDLLTGGAGGDTFAYAAWGDSTAAAPDSISDFQSGVDKLDFRRLGPVSLSFTPDGAGTLIQATGAGGTLVVRVSGPAGTGDVITEGALLAQVGSEGADILVAGPGDALLNGRGGDDVLLGGAGNDQLDGWTGADTLFGGGGDDGYWIDHGGDRAIELDGEGVDYVYTSVDFSLQAFIENIYLMGSAWIGAGGNALDNVIVGNSGNNWLRGFGGDDVFTGGLGADEMEGGKGADTFVYNEVGDSVANAFDNLVYFESGIDKIDVRALSPTSITWVEFSNYWSSSYWNTVSIETPGGMMTIRVSGQVTLADFLTGAATQGTEGDDNLIALAGPGELSGFGGNDTLTGSRENDLLEGGGGSDTLRGGAGDDSLDGGAGDGDTAVYAGNRADYEIGTVGQVTVRDLNAANGDEGTDSLGGVEFLRFADMTIQLGVDPNNAPQLGDPDMVDQIWPDGRPSSYTVPGTSFTDLDGDHTLTFHAALADRSPLPAWLTFDAATRTFSGTPPVAAIGATLAVLVTASDGSASVSDEFLIAVTQSPGGNDFLDGRSGAHVLRGGAGDDVYVVDSDDQAVELAGEGFDSVYARGSYALTPGSSIEVAATANYLATDFIILTGNEFNNAITGNNGDNSLDGLAGDDYLVGLEGNDRLDGGTGADFMVGGLGNDIYIVDHHFDEVRDYAGEGLDYLFTSTDYALRPGVEIELFATSNYALTTPLFLTGNELNNAITGNNGNNQMSGEGGDDHITGLDGHDIMDGGTGVDWMVGGTGNDVYYVDNAGDVAVELAGEGFDSLYTSASYRLTPGAEIEMLGTRNYLLTGALDIAGNEHNNIVVGSNGANLLEGLGGSDSLSGLDGADILDGGAGQDFLEGGAGADVFRFTSASHSAPGSGDTLVDFVSGTDRIDLSAIDADSNTAGDQAFTFVGSATFSGKAGELRSEAVGNQVHVYADVNGDGLADMHIVVASPLLTAGDFIP